MKDRNVHDREVNSNWPMIEAMGSPACRPSLYLRQDIKSKVISKFKSSGEITATYIFSAPSHWKNFPLEEIISWREAFIFWNYKYWILFSENLPHPSIWIIVPSGWIYRSATSPCRAGAKSAPGTRGTWHVNTLLGREVPWHQPAKPMNERSAAVGQFFFLSPG